MIKKKIDGDLIVISGPSGVGKDTVSKLLLNDDLIMSVSATTRAMREGEVHGKDYFFMSKEEFEEKIKEDEFLEYAIVHGKDYYGTLKSQVVKKIETGKDVLLNIDIVGALSIKEKYDKAIFIFLLPPSIQELKTRLIERHTENKDQLLRRFTSLYKEINEMTKYNYVVVNDKIEEAAKKINAILLSEKCRVDRIDDLEIDTDEEAIHEDIIKYYEKIDKETKK